MQKTGKVSFSNGEASLDDGTRLAICDDPSPFVAAGTFLRNKGIKEGNKITVTGDEGTIGGVAALCMTDAQKTATLAAAPLKKAKAKAAQKAAPDKAKSQAGKTDQPKRPASKKPRKSQ